MNIVIIANPLKDSDFSISGMIKAGFEERGADCVITELKTDQVPKDELELIRGADYCITVGGDGTLIRAAANLKGTGIPIIGVNKGTLGYLTEVGVEDIPAMTEAIMNGRVFPEDRMMIAGSVCRGGETVFESFALNDAVIFKQGYKHLMKLDVSVDEQAMCSYEADALIVSTPTGSTAYNLSAGGPLVVPSASMMVLTPVSAHLLNSRSVVIPGESDLLIRVSRRNSAPSPDIAVVFDGERYFEAEQADEIRLTRSAQSTVLARLSETSFYKILQKKLKNI